jgi:TRAP-type C4-dicarboxylate transport system permease small subunit
MSREAVRNICIVIALVLVVAVPAGGGALAGIVLLVLRILMIAAFLYFGYILWRENKHKTAWLPQRQRAILYAAAALLGVLLLGSFFYSNWNVVSVIVFFALVGGLGYLIWRILDDSRRYY